MKLIRTQDAVGHVLCHDMTQIIPGQYKDARFRKGHVVREEDIPVLLSMGKENLYVWEMVPGMVHENDAAERLCALCGNRHMIRSQVKEGKIELSAAADGLFRVDTARLNQINLLEDIMVATRHGSRAVRKGDKLCGTRVIPLVIEEEKLRRAEEIAGERPLLELLPYGAVLAVVLGVIALQHHMSAMVLVVVAAASVLFASGISLGWFAAGGALVGGALIWIITQTDYMKARIEIWQNPFLEPRKGGFQPIQSMTSIGSGGLLGKGLGNSSQKHLFLPEEHNDYIFSIACEELGMVGACVIMALFALLIIRGFWLALHARDRFGTLLVVGITSLTAFQTFFNIGVVTNFLPPTGISLPFFSYGGTALAIQLAEMGMVLSVSRQIAAPRAE